MVIQMAVLETAPELTHAPNKCNLFDISCQMKCKKNFQNLTKKLSSLNIVDAYSIHTQTCKQLFENSIFLIIIKSDKIL